MVSRRVGDSSHRLQHDVESQLAPGIGMERVTEIEAEQSVKEGGSGAGPDQRLGFEERVRVAGLSGIDEDDRTNSSLDRRQVELGRPERLSLAAAVVEPSHRI